MSNVYFISDLHLGHEKAIQFADNFRMKLLDIETPAEHDEKIIRNIMSRLVKRDKLFLLGDLGDGKMVYDMLKELPTLMTNIVPGNHDHDRDLALYASLPRVQIFPPATYKGHWITHHPIHPLELRNRKNVHGHVHTNNIPDENYINVSLEMTGGVPINFQTIKAGEYTTHDRKLIL